MNITANCKVIVKVLGNWFIRANFLRERYNMSFRNFLMHLECRTHVTARFFSVFAVEKFIILWTKYICIYFFSLSCHFIFKCLFIFYFSSCIVLSPPYICTACVFFFFFLHKSVSLGFTSNTIVPLRRQVCLKIITLNCAR